MLCFEIWTKKHEHKHTKEFVFDFEKNLLNTETNTTKKIYIL